MKFLVVLAVAFACASADVSHITSKDANAQVVRSKLDIDPSGAYFSAYETSNGIVAEAQAEVQNANSEYPSLAVKGVFKYIDLNGNVVETNYVADENGYQPQGSHLPVGPDIPEAIQRALAYIAAHPPPVENAKLF